MSADLSSQRYSAVAIVLHWTIAAAIAFMIPLGWWMGDALEEGENLAQAIAAYQVHKSVGLTILALSLARLAWRLTHRAPPLPDAMKPWERQLAVATHWAFYALMIAMPLTGWLYVSTQWSAGDDRPLQVPTLWFGLFEVPHLFGLNAASEGVRSAAATGLEFAHSKLAWGAIVLAALHAGAALKHHVVDRDSVLARMIPGLRAFGDARPRTFEPVRAGILAGGVIAFALAAFGVATLLQAPAQSAPAANAPTVAVSEPAIVTPPETELAEAQTPPAQTQTAADEDPEAVTWTVTPGESAIAFAGVHAGVPFRGTFSRWRADIRFHPEDLAHSRVRATIEMASASDGNALHDSTLPQVEWFDVANYPTAEFRADAFRRVAANRFEARGELRIKDRRIPLTLPFTLTISGDQARMEGQAQIARDAANLGQASDPGGEWVSPTIDVSVRILANRAP